MPSVALAVCLERTIPSEFFMEFCQLDMGIIRHTLPVQGAQVHKARQKAVDLFLNETTDDYLLFVDSDMGFPRDLALRLAGHALPIVSALCVRRDPPFLPTMLGLVENLPLAQRPREAGKYYHIPAWQDGALVTVDAVGAAAIMIRRDVLTTIAPPHFDFMEGRGEDVIFCEKARAAGFSIVVDTSVHCRHYTMTPFSVEHYYAARRAARPA